MTHLRQIMLEELERRNYDFGNLAWPSSAVCFGPPCGTLML